MAIQKLRREGDNLVVTISLEEAGKLDLVEGSYVAVEADEISGALRIQPIAAQSEGGRPDFIAIGRQVVHEDRSLLERLATYDPQERKTGT